MTEHNWRIENMNEQELLKIPGLEEDQAVTIKKFSWKEIRMMRSKSVTINIVDGKEKPDTNLGELQLYTVLYGIKEAPFFKKDMTEKEKIEVLDGPNIKPVTGDYLFREINKFNNMEDVKKLQKK